jgi:c-di-GMP-binding flagellar brake protein YcgR
MSSQPGKAPRRAIDRIRRRYPRFRSEFPVSIEFFSGGEWQQFDAHCKDLSQAGIGMLLAADLTMGEVVTLTFIVPGMEPWTVRAVLRHRRGFQYGCEFLSLSEEQKKVLADYLKGRERADNS